MRAEKTFCLPVLFSGIGALILTKPEKDILSFYVKSTTENLLKLHPKTPEPFIFLISGSLPAEATLHMRQLSLFLMICRLPDNILNSIAHHQLFSPGTAKTWFGQLETICFKYALPHPLQLLRDPTEKESFKKLVWTKIADFWKQRYVAQIKNDDLTSLRYFKPEFCSLLRPHPLLHTAGHSYEVNKMIVQLRLLSGRARLGSLLRHFSPENTGICELCNLEMEDLAHFLLPRCPALAERSEILLQYMKTVLGSSEPCLLILEEMLTGCEDDQELWIQFVLDCSVFPSVIAAAQKDRRYYSCCLELLGHGATVFTVQG